MKMYVVTDVDGEYDPLLFSTEKAANYWILNAGEEDVEYEIHELEADSALDADELEMAENLDLDAANSEEAVEEEEELEDA